MLAYEYKCQQCGYHFEEMQNMSDAPLEKCPQCGGQVERIISGGGGFLFKENHAAPAATHTPCCGAQGGCDNPKKCCEH